MNGTLVRNLEQPFLLFRVELPHEVNLALDPVDFAFLRLAIPAIRRVNFRMTKIHRHALEWPLLRSRIQRNRHRCARTERGQQQIVRRRPRIFPAHLDWFIRRQPMRANNDLLGEPRGDAANDYIRAAHATDITFISAGRQSSNRPPLDSYSVRSASIGFTRVARRAGTKHEAAATVASNTATEL